MDSESGVLKWTVTSDKREAEAEEEESGSVWKVGSGKRCNK